VANIKKVAMEAMASLAGFAQGQGLSTSTILANMIHDGSHFKGNVEVVAAQN
jgi:hypothetical protein